MRFLIALLWAIFITYLHAIPGNDITFFQLDDLFQLDKLFHLGVFFIGTWLALVYAYSKFKAKFYLIIFLAYTLYGLMLEIAQGFLFEGRHADPLDWFADALGVLLAVTLHRKIYISK